MSGFGDEWDDEGQAPGPEAPGHKPAGPPEPKLGSEAFGDDAKGRPTGSQAFGGADGDDPLRGALLFGNDPGGAPRGSELFGGAEPKAPLKGALLFGNDPEGAPRGSEAFGNAEPKVPLKGALLFGNDPEGFGRGSESFGTVEARFKWKGSEAFGAPQLVPSKLHKDVIGYDLVGILLTTDEGSLAGIRKDPRNRLRERVLGVLKRRLAIEDERVRHGLGENSIPWGRLKRDDAMDKALAEELRRWWRKAPGEVLGIDHLRQALETTERMHSFALNAEWDLNPVTLAVLADNKPVAFGQTGLHKEHRFFIFKDPTGEVLAYVDAMQPRRPEQASRVRTKKGETVALLTLVTPGPADDLGDESKRRFVAEVRDKQGVVQLTVREVRASPQSFRAVITDAEGREVGSVEDELSKGKVRTKIELDAAMSRTVAWGLGAVLADLARLRKRGWPEVPEQVSDEVPSVEDALGPRRRR